MKNNNKIYPNLSGLALALALAGLFSGSVFSDIKTDGSLGPPVETLKGPDFKITADKGRQAGTNLFHSFKIFNIHKGESSTFSGPANVKNIFSRVTGDSSSTIDGLLKSTIQGADFFIINPQGIFFGPDAKLELSGSFHASTANNIGFTDGTTFSVNNFDPNATLSVAAPQSFGFLGDNPAQISLDSANLSVQSGKEISLVGGDVDITANLFAGKLSKISAPNGGVNIVSRIAEGKVPLTPLSNTQMDNIFQSDNYGKITISIGSQVKTDGSGGKGIRIQAGHFVMDTGSQLTSTNTSDNGTGGIIIIDADQVNMQNFSRISSKSEGQGNSGLIEINTSQLIMNNSAITSETASTGNAGSLLITANESIDISGAGGISTNTFGLNIPQPDQQAGNAGDITITTPSLNMSGPVIISSSTSNDGAGGKIDIKAEQISLNNFARISSTTAGQGHAGQITIVGLNRFNNRQNNLDTKASSLDVSTITLNNSAAIFGSTNNDGNAANIELDVRDVIIKNRSLIDSTTGFLNADGKIEKGTGKGGNIRIKNANTVSLLEGPRIDSPNGPLLNCSLCANSQGPGDAGFIIIDTSQLIMKNAAIASEAHSTGNAGYVKITANESFEISDFGGVSTVTVAQKVFPSDPQAGNAGDVTITTPSLNMSGPVIISSSTSNDGAGGKIDIKAEQISLNNFARISSTTAGQGHAGQITIVGLNRFNNRHNNLKTEASSLDESIITLNNGATIFGSTNNDGNAANIELDVRDVIIKNRSLIDSTTGFLNADGKIEKGTGKGGNIRIKNSKTVSLLEGPRNDSPNGPLLGCSLCAISLGSGDAGFIDIDTSQLIMKNAAISSEASSTGNAGPIKITAKNSVDIAGMGGISTSTFGIYKSDQDQQSGNAGNINITTPSLSLNGAVVIGSNTSDNGNGGNININGNQVTLDNGARIQGSTSRAGNAANILLDVDHLLIKNGANIDTSTGVISFDGSFLPGPGKGGNIRIINAETVSLLNGPSLGCTICSSTLGPGDAGTIDISTAELAIKNSTIGLSTLGSGNAGSLKINAKKSIDISGVGGIIASSEPANEQLAGKSPGDAGNITLITSLLKLKDAAQIDSSTTGDGNAGQIILNIDDSLQLSNGARIESASGQISATGFDVGKGQGGTVEITAGQINLKDFNTAIVTSTLGLGKGGYIRIKTGKINLANQAGIFSASFGEGQGGNVNINANQVNLVGANTSLSTNTLGSGNAGNIHIAAKQLNLGNHATISSTSSATGDAGSIEIVGLKEFKSRQASVTTEASQSDGGNITIRAEDLVFLKNSAITASVKKGGNGGNIDIDPVFTILDNSRIIAQAEDGSGGNIKITTDFLLISGNSIIDASSNTGIDGQVIIQALDSEVLSSVETLPAKFLDAASILSKPCASQANRQSIQFVVREYEVLPQAPDVLQVHLPSLPPSGGVTNPGNTVASVADATMHLSSAAGCTEQ
jgi:filamentous hemagglutinin family protein